MNKLKLYSITAWANKLGFERQNVGYYADPERKANDVFCLQSKINGKNYTAKRIRINGATILEDITED